MGKERFGVLVYNVQCFNHMRWVGNESTVSRLTWSRQDGVGTSALVVYCLLERSSRVVWVYDTLRLVSTVVILVVPVGQV